MSTSYEPRDELPGRSLWLNLSRLDRQLLKAKDIGILTDADGTLSEIKDRPEAASVSEEITAALGRLSRLYKLVAVISGRRAADVQELVGQKDLLYLGNHGLERRWGDNVYKTPDALRAIEAVGAVRAELLRRLPSAPGLHVEDKESVIAIHYRECRDAAAIEAVKDLAALLAANHHLEVQHGRLITEIRPAEADKGGAIIQLVYERGLKHVVYIGDDATDIDAFIALGQAQRSNMILSCTRVAVIGGESPAGLKENADYWVSSVDEVARFLDWLVKRAERGGRS